MAADKRRDARYPARIIARVLRRNQSIELLTNDVSFRGVFIRTDSPPALRQLVKIELVVPESVIVTGHAMVVHVMPTPEIKGEGAVPGIGLQFWGPLVHGREWERFIHELRAREKAGIAAAKATDKVRRASERFKLQLEVVFDGKRTMTRDISENGMAIRTDVLMPIGTRAQLGLRSGDQVMMLDVIVRRTIDEPGFKGLGVELVALQPGQRESIVRFVRMSAPSEDSIFVEVDDPQLH